MFCFSMWNSRSEFLKEHSIFVLVFFKHKIFETEILLVNFGNLLTKQEVNRIITKFC